MQTSLKSKCGNQKKTNQLGFLREIDFVSLKTSKSKQFGKIDFTQNLIFYKTNERR